jgi:hypothetical protein
MENELLTYAQRLIAMVKMLERFDNMFLFCEFEALTYKTHLPYGSSGNFCYFPAREIVREMVNNSTR